MRTEVKRLKQKYRNEINNVCARVMEIQRATSLFAEDMAEIYGYPRGFDKVAWGVNKPVKGYNILRGIRLSNGDDIGVM